MLVSLSTFAFKGCSASLQAVVDARPRSSTPGSSSPPVPAIDPAELRAPANVELHRLVPHAELMP